MKKERKTMKNRRNLLFTIVFATVLTGVSSDRYEDYPGSPGEQGRTDPAGQQIRYVADTGTDEQNNCLASENPCATISHAVHVASVRDPIIVGAGTYNELFRLDNSLTLRLAEESYGRNSLHVQNLNHAARLQFIENLSFLFLSGLLSILLFVEIRRRIRSGRYKKTDPEKSAKSPKIPDPSGIEEASEEEVFLEEMNRSLEKHISDERFNVEMLAVEMNMSARHLRRKTRSITGESPVAILRRYRLERARQMLSQNADNISQIAYQCGFSDPGYFSRCFRNAYGKQPSQYKMV